MLYLLRMSCAAVVAGAALLAGCDAGAQTEEGAHAQTAEDLDWTGERKAEVKAMAEAHFSAMENVELTPETILIALDRRDAWLSASIRRLEAIATEATRRQDVIHKNDEFAQEHATHVVSMTAHLRDCFLNLRVLRSALSEKNYQQAVDLYDRVVMAEGKLNGEDVRHMRAIARFYPEGHPERLIKQAEAYAFEGVVILKQIYRDPVPPSDADQTLRAAIAGINRDVAAFRAASGPTSWPEMDKRLSVRTDADLERCATALEATLPMMEAVIQARLAGRELPDINAGWYAAVEQFGACWTGAD